MITCSVILPTRDRVPGVLALIDSLNEMTSELTKLEMFIKIDADDANSLSARDQMVDHAQFPVEVLVDDRLEGYCSLNVFVNRMAKMATGRWLWMLNDDVTVATKGWDDILRGIEESRHTRMGVIRCSYPYPEKERGHNPNNIFPIVSKELTQLIGHYSLTMYNDAYIDNVGEKAGTIRMHGWNPKVDVFPSKEQEIIVSHRMIHDHVRKESEAQYQWKLNDEQQKQLDAETATAIEKVKEFLAQ